MKTTYAVGLIVKLDGGTKLIVDSVCACSTAEALGKAIIEHDIKHVVDWSIKGDIDTHVRELVLAGQKIGAIKYVREELGMGLKESKKYVDNLI